MGEEGGARGVAQSAKSVGPATGDFENFRVVGLIVEILVAQIDAALTHGDGLIAHAAGTGCARVGLITQQA